MTPAFTTSTLRIMPREMRMMTERVFSLTRLPKGFVLTATDIVMYSQKLGLGGFALLETRFDELKEADPARIELLSEQGSRLDLGAGGEHAWFVVPTLVDLLGELAAHYGSGSVRVTNAADPDELRVAAALAARNGLSVVFSGGDEPLLTASSKTLSGDLKRDEPLLWDLLQNGTAIEAELWWRVYHLAQKALTPDSVVSRRHAGPLIVNDDGTVIGRKDNDDETDLSFLTSIGTGKTRKESAGS
ncbi:hypothetical protein [Nitratireductor thuwali]|uniref:Uncharacterized protein n=1 Tax=Nitratireductor thuwali TaxID=2267699 RepID=A0ABY5MI99_9HYPH|nr:hypothetical protein NTH_00944 [Nitratireductor thuwali]